MNKKRNAKKIIANVILARCKRNKMLYGITVEQNTSTEWVMKYSYPLDEKRARTEGFDKTSINADFYPSEAFPGCPYCGSEGFVKCGVCGKLTCFFDERSLTCSWCGRLMDNISYDGPMNVNIGSD